MQAASLLALQTASMVGDAVNLHSIIADVLWEPVQGVIIMRAHRGASFVTDVECDSNLHHDVFLTCIQAIGKLDDSHSTD